VHNKQKIGFHQSNNFVTSNLQHNTYQKQSDFIEFFLISSALLVDHVSMLLLIETIAKKSATALLLK